ncbi:hypothetical protein KAI19_05865, partial [bacterium]|nr:hypothetical protein [bacterium]
GQEDKKDNSFSLLTFFKFKKMLPGLIQLGIKEKILKLLARELEKTRRRVNALEYILIPNLEETITYITMKLGELELANIVRLMKIKDIARAK